MTREEAEAVVGRLTKSGGSWFTRFQYKGRDDLELEVLDVNGSPCPIRLIHARRCLENLDELVQGMELSLNEVEDHPMFPPKPARKWWFEGLSFSGQPTDGVGHFTHDDGTWDYLYVDFQSSIVNAKATGAGAR